MIDGLTDETIRELRRQYPRTQIAELISRIAAFPSHCWASAAYLAEQIGRSPRTVFRYFRRLREEQAIQRRWGSREFDKMPPNVKVPWALRLHGYKLTGFTGRLSLVVGAGRSERQRRVESKRRARERKEAARRERRERERADFDERFPALAKRAAEPRTPKAPPSKEPRYAAPEPLSFVGDVGVCVAHGTGPPTDR